MYLNFPPIALMQAFSCLTKLVWIYCWDLAANHYAFSSEICLWWSYSFEFLKNYKKIGLGSSLQCGK